jgi:hypothetical protein
MVGNKIAELAEERELSPRWLALGLLFHPLPCGRVQTRKPTFSYRSTRKPVGLQWKHFSAMEFILPKELGIPAAGSQHDENQNLTAAARRASPRNP